MPIPGGYPTLIYAGLPAGATAPWQPPTYTNTGSRGAGIIRPQKNDDKTKV